jgi:hypothetical protein
VFVERHGRNWAESGQAAFVCLSEEMLHLQDIF